MSNDQPSLDARLGSDVAENLPPRRFRAAPQAGVAAGQRATGWMRACQAGAVAAGLLKRSRWPAGPGAEESADTEYTCPRIRVTALV